MIEKRIIGVDLGEKRVGVAITDPLGLFAQPLCTLSGGKREVINGLLKLVAQYTASTIVLGLPVEMSGIEGPQAIKVRGFAELLEKRLKAVSKHLTKIAFVDERLTTVQASRILHGNDIHGRDAKERVDQVSAALILEAWLAATPAADL